LKEPHIPKVPSRLFQTEHLKLLPLAIVLAIISRLICRIRDANNNI